MKNFKILKGFLIFSFILSILSLGILAWAVNVKNTTGNLDTVSIELEPIITYSLQNKVPINTMYLEQIGNEARPFDDAEKYDAINVEEELFEQTNDVQSYRKVCSDGTIYHKVYIYEDNSTNNNKYFEVLTDDYVIKVNDSFVNIPKCKSDIIKSSGTRNLVIFAGRPDRVAKIAEAILEQQPIDNYLDKVKTVILLI